MPASTIAAPSRSAPRWVSASVSWLRRVVESLAGEPQDVHELEAVLADAKDRGLIDAEVLRMLEGVLEVSEIQVRDVALAVSILLSGQKLEDYGFNDQHKANAIASTVQNYSYSRYYLREGDRKAAFEKWKIWKAQHKNEKGNK